MENINTRIAICPKDIQKFTGKSLRWSQRTLKKIRESLNRKTTQIVTFVEFFKYMGLDDYEGRSG